MKSSQVSKPQFISMMQKIRIDREYGSSRQDSYRQNSQDPETLTKKNPPTIGVFFFLETNMCQHACWKITGTVNFNCSTRIVLLEVCQIVWEKRPLLLRKYGPPRERLFTYITQNNGVFWGSWYRNPMQPY